MDTFAAIPPVYSILMIIVTDNSYVFHVCSSTAVSQNECAQIIQTEQNSKYLYLKLQKQVTVRYSYTQLPACYTMARVPLNFTDICSTWAHSNQLWCTPRFYGVLYIHKCIYRCTLVLWNHSAAPFEGLLHLKQNSVFDCSLGLLFMLRKKSLCLITLRVNKVPKATFGLNFRNSMNLSPGYYENKPNSFIFYGG